MKCAKELTNEELEVMLQKILDIDPDSDFDIYDVACFEEMSCQCQTCMMVRYGDEEDTWED